MTFGNIWSQFFPPAPTFTEKHVKDEIGKVFIITGATSGIGLELVKALYPSGATIYLAGRSPEKIKTTITDITTGISCKTPAMLKSLHIDLSDLTTVKPAATAFKSQESRLDVLWNNAGSSHPAGDRTKQDIEANVGANCVAPLLFTIELLSLLKDTAMKAPKDTVRIVWSGSVQIEMKAPNEGIDFETIDKGFDKRIINYAASKAGNWFFAYEGAKRWGRDGVISVCQNPGNLVTGIYVRQPWWVMLFMRNLFLYEPKYGVYTMLYAGLSSDVTSDNNGAYIWPWGRIEPVDRPDVVQAASEGKAAEFWEWCENAWKPYV